MDLFSKDFTWDNRRHFISQLEHKDKVKFALFCAKQVAHLNSDSRCKEAIITVEKFLLGEASQEECRAAADAAAYAAYAARVAYAAARVADAAAYAADDADDAADDAAAAAAAYADAAAAYADAAAAAADAMIKEQIIADQLSYLRELVILNLPEEQRENWLLIACF